MSEELMITKEDLVNWLNRPPSNDDLDLIGFITTRLENFYKLEQENKQLKENYQFELEENSKLSELWCKNNKILTELEEWLKEETKLSDDYFVGECHTDYTDVLDKIQELKEKHK